MIVKLPVSQRARTRLLVACMVVSFAFIAFWFIGQEASADPTLVVPAIVANLYPGTWPPVARGLLWLFVGATAVGFNLTMMYPYAETRTGRVALAVATGITGSCFLAFAVASFAGASWSVIH